MGPGRPQLRYPDHLVPSRRRPLHRLYLHRRAGPDVRRRRHRFLCGALCGADVSHGVHRLSAAVERGAPPRLHHRRRFREGPLWPSRVDAGHRRHRPCRRDALHRAAAGGHAGGDRGAGAGLQHDPAAAGQRVGAAAGSVLRSGGLHLYIGPARHGADRGGQGSAGLYHRAGGDHHHSRRTGRIRQGVRLGPAQAVAAAAGAGSQPGCRLCLYHPGAGLAAGAVPVSAFGDGHPVVVLAPCHSPQRHPAAGLFGGFGADRAAWVHGGGVGREPDAGICGGLQKLRQQFRGAGAVPAHVPALVCRTCLRRHRHRRADAGLHHGDRLRQPLHPQHLQGVHRPGLHAADGGQDGQAGGVRGQAGGAVLCAGAADHLRYPAATLGRHLDLPDGAQRAPGALCAA